MPNVNLLVLAAVVLFVVAAIVAFIGAGVSALGLVAAGLACWAASTLVG